MILFSNNINIYITLYYNISIKKKKNFFKCLKLIYYLFVFIILICRLNDEIL